MLWDDSAEDCACADGFGRPYCRLFEWKVPEIALADLVLLVLEAARMRRLKAPTSQQLRLSSGSAIGTTSFFMLPQLCVLVLTVPFRLADIVRTKERSYRQRLAFLIEREIPFFARHRPQSIRSPATCLRRVEMHRCRTRRSPHLVVIAIPCVTRVVALSPPDLSEFGVHAEGAQRLPDRLAIGYRLGNAESQDGAVQNVTIAAVFAPFVDPSAENSMTCETIALNSRAGWSNDMRVQPSNDDVILLLAQSRLVGIITISHIAPSNTTRRDVTSKGLPLNSYIFVPSISALQQNLSADETLGPIPSPGRSARLTLVQPKPFVATILEDHSDKSAFSDIWTLSGSGRSGRGSQVQRMVARSPRSASCTCSTRSAPSSTQRWHVDFSALRDEGRRPGTASEGIVAFVRERLVDVGSLEDERHDWCEEQTASLTSQVDQHVEAMLLIWIDDPPN
ncbi:unnamed protein product [Mycena citricolor]|uniref:Uncharacterized protein n=1 Tax=Mycena citricolor TaxID=2018698 RepID=A0AAD2H4A0_9AGAR|nr:unnamed protein product [Mycena citricolor]